MPLQRVHFAEDVPEVFRASLQDIRRELEVPAEFPPEVVAAALAAVKSPRLPELDRTDIEFVTVDPPDSMDLDQALHIERTGDGYTVYYAIADVAAFVQPGDPIDVEARRRGETLYAPDKRTPLHPPELSEGAASLLPDQVCPAAAVDDHGRCVRRRHRRGLRAGVGEVAGEAELRRRAEGSRRRQCIGVAATASRGRQAPRAARARPRRCQPAHPGPGGRHLQPRLGSGVPRTAAGRGLERADLACSPGWPRQS